MSKENEILKDIQTKVNNHVEKQKKVWADDQVKAKAFFEDLKQEGITNFEHAKGNIQKHIQEVNSFTKNLQLHFQTQPFDLTAFSKVVSDYQAKQLEILAEAAKVQTQKLTEFQNKMVSYYHKAHTDLHNATQASYDTHEEEDTSETPEVAPKPAAVKKVAPRKPAVKKVVKKTT